MPESVRILCLAGSSRAGSLNRRLAAYCARRLGELGVEAEVFDLHTDPLPLYDGDLEEKGLPEPARRLAEAVDDADGVLLVCPEYNAGMTGAMKNALDWCSRVPSAQGRPRVFTGKPVALAAASPGALGGVRGLAHARLVLIEMGAHVSPADTIVPAAHESLDAEGRPVAERGQASLERTLAKLLEMAGMLA